MPAILRRAGPADAAAIHALTHAAYAKWVPVLGRSPLPMTVDYDEAVRKHRIDLLVDDGSLVALVEMEQRDRDLLVVNLAVAPDRQGRGFGRRLLAHAEALAAAAGHGIVRLYTNALFSENLAFYAASGFAVEREEPFRGGTVVHMVKHGTA